MTRTRIALGWSGGKDSMLALERLRADPAVEVAGLITTISTAFDRISIHGVRRRWLQAQAAGLGLEVIEAALPPEASNAVYERVFAGAVVEAQRHWPGLAALAFGDLFLADIRAYRERQVGSLGLACRFPLWGEPTDRLARDFIDRGYRAWVVCINTALLPARLAGRAYDARFLGDLPAGADPCGENGEFHTFVHDGPPFTTPVACVPGGVVERSGCAFAELDPGETGGTVVQCA
jgi:uncharacterized protein (TIGR00290 family)